MPVRVFLIEGREIIKQGIKAMLDNAPGVQLAGDAADDTEALGKVETIRPDVVLLNMYLPASALLDFTRQIKKNYPSTKLLILTTQDDESLLIRLFQEGADGYVPKNPTREELMLALTEVKHHGSYLKPKFVSSRDSGPETSDMPRYNLSAKELQVLELIAEGMTNMQIAKKLFASVRTIETRRKKLLEKTGTTNTATLIRFAVLNGLIR